MVFCLYIHTCTADHVHFYLYEHTAKDLLLQRPEAEPNPFFYINN